MATGPRGSHINQDSYDGAAPAKNAPALVKVINAGDAKFGPRLNSHPQAKPINPDTYSE